MNINEAIIKRIEEICKEKNNLVRKVTSLNDFRYEFEDEVWRFVKPNGNARGIKYNKCYVICVKNITNLTNFD